MFYFERQSGYAGYRNDITGEWFYENDFKAMQAMPKYDNVETSDGLKTLLRTHKDQRTFAESVDSESLYCLLPHPEGWVVEMISDDIRDVDLWWENQKVARVYYGQTGKLRHAK